MANFCHQCAAVLLTGSGSVTIFPKRGEELPLVDARELQARDGTIGSLRASLATLAALLRREGHEANCVGSAAELQSAAAKPA